MAFKQSLGRMDAAIFRVFGDVATYDGVTPCKLIIERNIERHNQYGESLGRKTLISVRKSEVPTVEKGRSFQVGTETITINDIVSEDDSIITVST